MWVGGGKLENEGGLENWCKVGAEKSGRTR